MSLGNVLVITLPAVLLAAALGAGIAHAFLHQARRRFRAELRERLRTAECFRIAAEDARDGLAIHDLDFKILWANPAYLQMMGRPAEEVIGRTPFDYAFPPDATPGRAELRSLLAEVRKSGSEMHRLFRNRRGDGSLFWNQISMGFRTTSSGETHVVIVCRDVTKAVEQEEEMRDMRDRLAHEASHDALTGLANRSELRRFMGAALYRAAERGERVAVIRIDLDRFKDINDTHGHSAGDDALIHVAGTLGATLRAGDMVARVGGDEFVAVCPGVPDLAALDRLGHGLSAALSRPFRYNDLDLFPRASIGCALSELGATDHQEVLLQSDFALYEAKRSGRGRVVIYDEGLHHRHSRMQSRAADLRDTVGSTGLDHVFQPVVELGSGHITGFETLVRWHHEDDGVISPADFLPLAEELGLLATIDLSSMGAAMTIKRELAAAGHGQTILSFNASSDLLMHPGFINQLVFGAESVGMERGQIAIEVLETTVFTDHGESNSPARIIRDLRDAGFNIYLDDFGMGYAGLAHLAELAITGIKIDRALVKRILASRTSAKIVGTIIDLCSDLGLRVIAEGVEDAATAQRLYQMGCPHIQGFWISPPMPADEALEFARTNEGLIRLPQSWRGQSAG